MLGLDPTFPLKYMVYFLLVVRSGGAGTIKGPLVAALILGVFDVAGKYYVPQIGGFVIYALMVVLLIALSARGFMDARVTAVEGTRDAARPCPRPGAGVRWRSAFWLVAARWRSSCSPIAACSCSQILIAGLFAVSLDLILGYAGIVSLGHAAFFGIGAYTAGLLARARLGRAAVGARRRGGRRRRRWVTSVSFLVVRGGDLTRLMVTLGIGLMLSEAANQASSITGGVDGLSRRATIAHALRPAFASTSTARTAYLYASRSCSPCSCSRGGSCIRRSAWRCAASARTRERMPAIGAPSTAGCARSSRWRPAIAGVAGALLAQTTQFVGIDTLGFPRSAELLIMLVLGGTGRLYGGLVGAAVFMVAQDYLAGINPVYWQFWLGLLLVVDRALRARRAHGRARARSRGWRNGWRGELAGMTTALAHRRACASRFGAFDANRRRLAGRSRPARGTR